MRAHWAITIAFWGLTACANSRPDFATDNSTLGHDAGSKPHGHSPSPEDVDGGAKDSPHGPDSTAPDSESSGVNTDTGSEAGPSSQPDEPSPNASAPNQPTTPSPTGSGQPDNPDGPTKPVTPDGPANPGGPGNTQPLDPGVACNSDDQCKSSHCVDEVCCDTACDMACGACNLPNSLGTCSTPETDDACAAAVCPEDTECRTYQPPSALTCDSLGVCSTLDCTPVDLPVTQQCSSGEGTCDGAGACVVPTKASLGEACNTGTDCAQGNCVTAQGGTKVCCDNACTGNCQACGSDGHCDAAPEQDARCAKVTCPTGDACVSYPDPVSQQCSSFGQCETTQTYCTPIYKDAGESCGSGLACNGQGACGSVCADNQVWCTSACVDPQTDDAHCGADDNCSGGQACTDGTACEGGVCLVQCSGGDVRCDNTCIDPTSDSTYCGASGSCSGATAGTECSAGACMQSKCRTWKGHSQLWDASSGQGVSVFPTPNGDFLVTYTQYDINTSTQDIWFDRYSASAHSWAGGEHVEDIDLFANGGVAGVDGQGTTFAVWFQNDPNDGPTRIRTASRSNAGWGSSIGLSAQGTISMWPKLSILSNGDAIAAWGQQASTPSDPEHVYFARRTGGAWQNAAAVESQTGISQVQHLAAGGNGTAMVLWVNYPPSSTNSALYASLWSGSSWGTPAKLADDTTTKLYATSAGDSSGNYYVAWSESDSGVHRVKVRRYSASTSTWGTVKTFVDAAGSYVSTAVTNDGIPHITWTDVDTKFTWVSTDPSNGDWLTPLTMGTGYGDAVGARCDSAGNVILLWRDNNVLKWRYKASGASSFASEQPIMDLTGYVFSHAWAMNPDGSAMAGYSFGPGDGSANLGFNPFE